MKLDISEEERKPDPYLLRVATQSQSENFKDRPSYISIVTIASYLLGIAVELVCPNSSGAVVLKNDLYPAAGDTATPHARVQW